MDFKKEISSPVGIAIVVVATVVIIAMIFIVQYFVIKRIGSPGPGQLVEQPSSPAGWPTYVSKDGKFMLEYPPEWELSTTEGNEKINLMYLIGKEGSIQTHYGEGFGGTCILGSEKINYGRMTFDSCNSVDKDGLKQWVLTFEKDGYKLGMYVAANKPYEENQKTVLRILSTARFVNK
jgi:hypothetical protein